MPKKHYMILALILFISLNPSLLVMSALLLFLLAQVAAAIALIVYPIMWMIKFFEFEIGEIKGIAKRKLA